MPSDDCDGDDEDDDVGGGSGGVDDDYDDDDDDLKPHLKNKNLLQCQNPWSSKALFFYSSIRIIAVYQCECKCFCSSGRLSV
ncbi:hypothetical protein PoB_000096500 [Plakobranchus ocellatus]|uniref:Uncharacterized protein n=1 Tax=Plakobranchus ocellatus TaxID=259542 RepID=A0AAV3XUZ8_9GAST|nr:hypothetical protein PoB_000096500 [Plakobranchus ocellatus]